MGKEIRNCQYKNKEEHLREDILDLDVDPIPFNNEIPKRMRARDEVQRNEQRINKVVDVKVVLKIYQPNIDRGKQ